MKRMGAGLRGCRNIASLSVLCALLIACDGGIFGTGDGGSESLIDSGVSASDSELTDGAQPETDSDAGTDTGNAADNALTTGSDAGVGVGASDGGLTTNTEGDNELEPLVESTEDFVPAEDAAVSVDDQLMFENPVLIAGDDARFGFLNDTDRQVSLVFFEGGDAMERLIVSPNVVGQGFVEQSDTAMRVDDTTTGQDRIPLVNIDPLRVVQGSRSLFVLTQTDSGFRLLAAPSYNIQESTTVFPHRFVAANLEGDPAVPSVLTLSPNPAFNGAGSLPTITFDPINNDLPITNYENVPPGQYLLNDDAGRFNNVELEFREDLAFTTTIFTSIDVDNTVRVQF